MSSLTTQSFFHSVKNRCSCYALTNTSPISDEKINFIISFAVKHAPSPFNVQSARAVVLVKQEHEKLWDIADALMKKSFPEPAYKALAPRVQGFRAGYGSVLWFEDQAALEALRERQPAVKDMVQECMFPPRLPLPDNFCGSVS